MSDFYKIASKVVFNMFSAVKNSLLKNSTPQLVSLLRSKNPSPFNERLAAFIFAASRLKRIISIQPITRPILALGVIFSISFNQSILKAESLAPEIQPMGAALRPLLDKAVDYNVHYVRQEGLLGEWQGLNTELSDLLVASPLDVGALNPSGRNNENLDQLAIDPTWPTQLREFVESKNGLLIKTENGFARPQLREDLAKDLASIQNRIRSSLNDNQVIRYAMSTLASISFDKLPSSFKATLDLMLSLDQDHVHQIVPADVVNLALPADHHFLSRLNSEQDYLFSAIDFRRLDCAFASNAISIFNSLRNLSNFSLGSGVSTRVIYLLSEVTVDSEQHHAWALKEFGRPADRVISQIVIYSSSVLRASLNHFYFFKKGDATQIVLVSDNAIGREHVGDSRIGSFVRPILFGGFGEESPNSAGALSTSLRGQGARNSAGRCTKGVAMGLDKYFISKIEEVLEVLEE